MQIRIASQNDAMDVYQWRNDATSKQMFFNDGEITLEQHLNWFTAALESEKRRLLIGVLDGIKIGVCRFDIDINENSAEVSINLNPHMRNRKLSQPFLSASIAFFINQHQYKLTAKVKKINLASMSIFEKNGFTCVKENKLVKYYEFK